MVMQPGCLRLLAEAYDDNLCYPDDTMFHGELATSWLCDADYFRRYFHEGYYHYCADNEMTEVSRLLGKLRYVPAAVSVHECMKTDPSLADSTYLANKLRLAEDKALFKARRKRNFDIPGHLIACGNGRGA
jgi:GT2 family glycosyltransferase